MIHADSFSFEVTGRSKATESTSELSATEQSAQLKEVLVAFVSAEKIDESAPRDVAVEAAGRIRETADKVGANRLMVYPYAHLSSSLARPRIAAEIIDTLVSRLRADRKFETHRAPFGFYKSFDIYGSCSS
jgi:threonyl-tRNA synthetase